jgi:transposase
MSTSLIYHVYGIRGYQHVKTEYKKGSTYFTIRHNEHSLRCPLCRSRNVIRRGSERRTYRTLPIGHSPTFLVLRVQKVYCPRCLVLRQVRTGFSDPRKRYTSSFERYALELLKHMTILDVADHLGVSWDTIKDIQKQYLHKRYSRPKLAHVRQIAIDEISIGAGHRYVTVVLDLETGAVLHVGDGKGADALKPFFRRLMRSGGTIEAVAMDMSPSFISAVTNHIPSARIVFDRFHVVKLMNHKLSEFRRALFHEASRQQKAVLKGIRWLLLKNPENLREGTNERNRLYAALRLNAPLATAYYMKEDLRQLWLQRDRKAAVAFLDDWVGRATASGIGILKRFAKLLVKHREGLLAWYDYPISTGPLEGTNNKIQLMKRQAYGFRDMEFFKLRILAIHQAKIAYVG